MKRSLPRPVDFSEFTAGRDRRAWERLGAHLVEGGVAFAVWAPRAQRVSVAGEFNAWSADASPLVRDAASGVWHGVVEGAKRGQLYKLIVDGVEKADPFGLLHEAPPNNASIVWSLEYAWNDAAWLKGRAQRQKLDAPLSIYEVHLGSWMAGATSYKTIAPKLAEHAKRLGFTHVELMPVMEHPFFGSWGYGCTGYFAPTHRYGTPQDLMFLVDVLHQQDVGVIFDWVPAHFPGDSHALAKFDGQALFEPADPRRGFNPEWGSYVFDYARPEVRSFLHSSAAFWASCYHADGLRVDGVAAMLYLDYGRKPGEWLPNEDGTRENRDAVAFVRELTTALGREHPDVITIAEESTAWPGVTKPTAGGGLGFALKWDMGWSHDALTYLAHDPLHRKHQHDKLTFRSMYQANESWVLALSHDETKTGKGSLLQQMPGDEWQKLANVRVLLGYQYALPGKKLLFMGDEIAERRAWHHDHAIDWSLLERPEHAGIARLVSELNRLHREEPALHARDADGETFEWIDGSDREQSVLLFLRKGARPKDVVLCALNFTPVPRREYRVGLPMGGAWREILNTDAREYGGSGHGNLGGAEATPIPWHGRRSSMVITLPPLGAVFFRAPE